MVSNKSNKSADLLLLEIEKLNSRLNSAIAELNALRHGKGNPELFTKNKSGQHPTIKRNSNAPLTKSEIRYSSVYNSMSDGMAIHEIVYNQDVSERKLISDTQNFLLSNSYTGTGEDFFESLAKFLALILKMDYVCIDKLEGDNLTARTVAIYNDGKFDTNITYSLKETPCGDVVGKTICCFPRNVCELFPNDHALAELFAEGYIGTTLWSFTGTPIGLIAVISRKPIENPQIAEIILKLVAIRAAGELERKNSQEVIIESENRFRTIGESLTVMISIVRICDSVLTFTNEPFEKTFGYGMDGTTEKKYPDSFYDPDDFINIRDILRGGGVINNREVLVKRTNGSNIWIMLSVRKIIFINEPSYISIAIDISETKRAQLELLRLNRLLNAHLKSSHAMMHSDNEMDYINEVCKIIIEDCGHSMVWIGYAQNDDPKSVVPVAHYGFDNGYIDKLNISWDDTDRGRGPTGTAIRTGKYTLCRNMLTDPAFEPWRKAAIERGYASSLVMPLISDGKPFGAISLYSKDPDPFSETEIALIKELADDLAYGISVIRLTESERAAARAIKENEAKLKELIATKDKFFNIVAHDLKNPFTSLLGASELLFDNIGQMTPDNVKELALILNDSAKGGYAILQNLLDWSRSQTGLLKLNPENLNLRDLIDENIYNLQLQVTNKQINMLSELKDDLFICADKNMINTVLRNLLSNAVKYTYKNGNIEVRVTNAADEVIITVKDSGIGISKEKAETLFRLENSLSLPGTEKEQGTGLGLKLCKEFTEKMGGRIWVESDSGQGSEFKFTIPLNGTKAQGRNGAMQS